MAKLSTDAKTIERDDGGVVDLTTAIDRKRRIDTADEVYRRSPAGAPKLVRRALGADAVFMTLESRSPDEIFACGGYGAKGSVGFLPARVSLSHCFHSGVW